MGWGHSPSQRFLGGRSKLALARMLRGTLLNKIAHAENCQKIQNPILPVFMSASFCTNPFCSQTCTPTHDGPTKMSDKIAVTHGICIGRQLYRIRPYFGEFTSIEWSVIYSLCVHHYDLRSDPIKLPFSTLNKLPFWESERTPAR